MTRFDVSALSVFGDLLEWSSSSTSAATVGRIAAVVVAVVSAAVAIGLGARGVTRAVRRPKHTAHTAHTAHAAHAAAPTDAATKGRRWLIGLAVTAAVGVAALGGVRSFEAVSVKFGSSLVPLTADGMIIACTALRLAALTRGWRLPGSVATTYGFIAGTVWLNVAAAHGWTDAVAHALAPVSYAVLVEMLAHMLRLHLRLAQPSRPRVTALTWFTSPVVTTRVWLHMARTGEPDPLAARALVQQLIRMASRLAAVCPSRPGLAWLPFGRARAARVAALQTIRDGLLSAADLATLLPTEATRLDPAALLVLVDRTALQCTTVTAPVRTDQRTASRTSDRTTDDTSAPSGDRTSAPDQHDNSTEPGAPVLGRDGRTDDQLVAVLHDHADEHNKGRPLSQREVMRVLGVGTPKAKRLAMRAGWLDSSTTVATDAQSDAQSDAQRPPEVPEPLALVDEPSDTAAESQTRSREDARVIAGSNR